MLKLMAFAALAVLGALTLHDAIAAPMIWLIGPPYSTLSQDLAVAWVIFWSLFFWSRKGEKR